MGNKLSNYEFLKDKEMDTKFIYELAARDNIEQSLFTALASNFVIPDEPVLRNPKRDGEINPGKGVEFDKKTGTYRATEYGFVHYEGSVAVEILPIVYIPENRSKMVLILPPMSVVKHEVTIQDIMEVIHSYQVETGIDYEMVRQATDAAFKDNMGAGVVLAEGREPKHGKVAKVILDYDFSMNVGKETEDGKIDFKERGFVHNVKDGELIAHFDSPIEPVDGLDIDGNPIQAELDKDPIYKLGKNLRVDEQTKQILSTVNGILSIAGTAISVQDIMEVKSDVNYNTGNLNAQGSVVINGSITPGFEVRAEGDVIVKNNIEEATVECGGNVIVSGGIMGNEKTHIKCNGNVKANFVRNAKIEAAGDVVVSQSILTADIHTDGRIIAVEGKGVVVGGDLKAAGSIFCKILGTKKGTKTSVTVGKSLNMEQRLKEIAEKTKKNKENAKKLKGTLGEEYFRDPKAFLMKLPKAKAPMVKQVLQQLTSIIKENNEFEEEKEEIINKANKFNKSHVTVYETVNEGVDIYIKKEHEYINRQLSPTEFYFNKQYNCISERAPRSLDEKEYNYF